MYLCNKLFEFEKTAFAFNKRTKRAFNKYAAFELYQTLVTLAINCANLTFDHLVTWITAAPLFLSCNIIGQKVKNNLWSSGHGHYCSWMWRFCGSLLQSREHLVLDYKSYRTNINGCVWGIKVHKLPDIFADYTLCWLRSIFGYHENVKSTK